MICLALGPWIWIAEVPTAHCLAVGGRGRTIVADVLHVEAAGLAVKLDPVHGRRAPDKQELVLGQVKQDAVADHIAVVADRHHLFGLVDGETVEAVDRQR
jgi:hypothetical protein